MYECWNRSNNLSDSLFPDSLANEISAFEYSFITARSCLFCKFSKPIRKVSYSLTGLGILSFGIEMKYAKSESSNQKLNGIAPKV